MASIDAAANVVASFMGFPVWSEVEEHGASGTVKGTGGWCHRGQQRDGSGCHSELMATLAVRVADDAGRKPG
jgi:hypothetical protein